MASRIGVIGIGNPLMGDDGAGIAVLDILKEYGLPSGAELIELGTGGLSLLHKIEGFNRVVLADAVDFGGEPGEVQLFLPEEVDTIKTVGYSLHDVDILRVIELAKQLEKCPETIVIAAIQPVSLKHSTDLSPQVKANIDVLANKIRDLVNEWAE